MSKPLHVIALLAASVAASLLLAAPALAAKSVETTLEVKYKEADASDPYGKSSFKGTVGPRKCAKGRTVTIKGYGSDETNRKGKFELELSGPAFPGRYKVKVAAEERKGVTCEKVKATLKIPKSG